jgi:hypothetical protein
MGSGPTAAELTAELAALRARLDQASDALRRASPRPPDASDLRRELTNLRRRLARLEKTVHSLPDPAPAPALAGAAARLAGLSTAINTAHTAVNTAVNTPTNAGFTATLTALRTRLDNAAGALTAIPGFRRDAIQQLALATLTRLLGELDQLITAVAAHPGPPTPAMLADQKRIATRAAAVLSSLPSSVKLGGGPVAVDGGSEPTGEVLAVLRAAPGSAFTPLEQLYPGLAARAPPGMPVEVFGGELPGVIAFGWAERGAAGTVVISRSMAAEIAGHLAAGRLDQAWWRRLLAHEHDFHRPGGRFFDNHTDDQHDADADPIAARFRAARSLADPAIDPATALTPARREQWADQLAGVLAVLPDGFDRQALIVDVWLLGAETLLRGQPWDPTWPRPPPLIIHQGVGTGYRWLGDELHVAATEPVEVLPALVEAVFAGWWGFTPAQARVMAALAGHAVRGATTTAAADQRTRQRLAATLDDHSDWRALALAWADDPTVAAAVRTARGVSAPGRPARALIEATVPRPNLRPENYPVETQRLAEYNVVPYRLDSPRVADLVRVQPHVKGVVTLDGTIWIIPATLPNPAGDDTEFSHATAAGGHDVQLAFTAWLGFDSSRIVVERITAESGHYNKGNTDQQNQHIVTAAYRAFARHGIGTRAGPGGGTVAGQLARFGLLRALRVAAPVVVGFTAAQLALAWISGSTAVAIDAFDNIFGLLPGLLAVVNLTAARAAVDRATAGLIGLSMALTGAWLDASNLLTALFGSHELTSSPVVVITAGAVNIIGALTLVGVYRRAGTETGQAGVVQALGDAITSVGVIAAGTVALIWPATAGRGDEIATGVGATLFTLMGLGVITDHPLDLLELARHPISAGREIGASLAAAARMITGLITHPRTSVRTTVTHLRLLIDEQRLLRRFAPAAGRRPIALPLPADTTGEQLGFTARRLAEILARSERFVLLDDHVVLVPAIWTHWPLHHLPAHPADLEQLRQHTIRFSRGLGLSPRATARLTGTTHPGRSPLGRRLIRTTLVTAATVALLLLTATPAYAAIGIGTAAASAPAAPVLAGAIAGTVVGWLVRRRIQPTHRDQDRPVPGALGEADADRELLAGPGLARR